MFFIFLPGSNLEKGWSLNQGGLLLGPLCIGFQTMQLVDGSYVVTFLNQTPTFH